MELGREGWSIKFLPTTLFRACIVSQQLNRQLVSFMHEECFKLFKYVSNVGRALLGEPRGLFVPLLFAPQLPIWFMQKDHE